MNGISNGVANIGVAYLNVASAGWRGAAGGAVGGGVANGIRQLIWRNAA